MRGFEPNPLATVLVNELLEAEVGAQRRKMRAGIDGGEVAVPGGKGFPQRGQGFFFVAASRVSRTQPEKVDGSPGLLNLRRISRDRCPLFGSLRGSQSQDTFPAPSAA